VFGREYDQPRLVAWHGDPGATYRYSRLTLQPLPWTALLLRLRDQAQSASGARFNSVLLNYYRDQHDSMGMHSDDERELGPNPVIASFSFGAARQIVFRHKSDRAQRPVRLTLADGSLLIMRGATQQYWKHGIEKRRTACGARVNLTFRLITASSVLF
jgi:alkylated DNA repair dioxygenase AlkB